MVPSVEHNAIYVLTGDAYHFHVPHGKCRRTHHMVHITERSTTCSFIMQFSAATELHNDPVLHHYRSAKGTGYEADEAHGFNPKALSGMEEEKQSPSTGLGAPADDTEVGVFDDAVMAVVPIATCSYDTLKKWRTALLSLRASRKKSKGRPSVTMVQHGKDAKKGADGQLISARVPPIVPHCPFPTSNR